MLRFMPTLWRSNFDKSFIAGSWIQLQLSTFPSHKARQPALQARFKFHFLPQDVFSRIKILCFHRTSGPNNPDKFHSHETGLGGSTVGWSCKSWPAWFRRAKGWSDKVFLFLNCPFHFYLNFLLINSTGNKMNTRFSWSLLRMIY